MRRVLMTQRAIRVGAAAVAAAKTIASIRMHRARTRKMFIFNLLLITLAFVAYNTYSGSDAASSSLFSGIPSTLAFVAGVIFAAAAVIVAFLCIIIYLCPRTKPSTPPKPLPSTLPSTLPTLPPPPSPPSILIIGYGPAAQTLWANRAAFSSSARWACPVQYEMLLRSRGSNFVEGITFVQQFSDVSGGGNSVGDLMEGVRDPPPHPLHLRICIRVCDANGACDV
jgi:hypothetical protein